MKLTIRETWNLDGSPKATVSVPRSGWTTVRELQQAKRHSLSRRHIYFIPQGVICVEPLYVQEITLK